MQKDLMGDLQAIERACAGMQLAWDSHDKDLMAALVNKLNDHDELAKHVGKAMDEFFRQRGVIV
jgi:hypothetical protein